MTKNDRLSRKQQVFVKAILTNISVRNAALAAGISETTAYRWLRLDVVKTSILDSENEALAEISRGLLKLAKGAIAALENILNESDNKDKLKAVDIILSKLLAIRELTTIETRLSELEAQQQ